MLQVTLTIGIAETALKRQEERTIGDKSIVPAAEPYGDVVIGAPHGVQTLFSAAHGS